MRAGESERQAKLQLERARETQGSSSVREHRAVQLLPQRACAPTARKLVRCYSSEGRRLQRDLSESEALRKEQQGKVTLKRKDGRIVSAQEIPPARRYIVDARSSGLFRVRFTELDHIDERALPWRVAHKAVRRAV